MKWSHSHHPAHTLPGPADTLLEAATFASAELASVCLLCTDPYSSSLSALGSWTLVRGSATGYARAAAMHPANYPAAAAAVAGAHTRMAQAAPNWAVQAAAA